MVRDLTTLKNKPELFISGESDDGNPIITSLVQTPKQMAAIKRKNAALILEMNQREDVLGLQADFEAILDDK